MKFRKYSFITVVLSCFIKLHFLNAFSGQFRLGKHFLTTIMCPQFLAFKLKYWKFCFQIHLAVLPLAKKNTNLKLYFVCNHNEEEFWYNIFNFKFKFVYIYCKIKGRFIVGYGHFIIRNLKRQCSLYYPTCTKSSRWNWNENEEVQEIKAIGFKKHIS